MVKVLRFVFPIIFAIAGFFLASYVVRVLALRISEVAASYDLIPQIDGNVLVDATTLLGLSTVAGLIVYLLLGIPIAAIFILVTKIIRSTAYDIDIAQIGNRFGGMRMVRRAAVPALFSVSLSGFVMQIVTNALYHLLDTVPPQAIVIYNALTPLIGVLITMPVVLAIFAPTWILNDAGIVMHLREDQLTIRRCPDTIGVGRWVNNLLAGFTIFTIPIISFAQHFLPMINDGVTDIILYAQALVFSLGIPFIAMAFIVPIIVLNEIILGLVRRPVRRFAKSLGARELKIETVITETEIVDTESDEEFGWGLKSSKSKTAKK